MKINLFSVSIWVGNINADKLNFPEQNFKKTFGSEIKTSYDNGIGSKLTEESGNYLLNTIANLLNETLTDPYNLQLQNIWENSYEQGDFQEKHIHPESDLSFIVYKKVEESKTVFMNPADKLIGAFYPECKRKQSFFGPVFYIPECRSNQIIIFPSFIEHYVKKTNNATTIAGNLKITFNQ